MIKILKYGTLHQVHCSKCGATLQYDENEDLKQKIVKDYFLSKRTENFIVCPQCDNEILIAKTPMYSII